MTHLLYNQIADKLETKDRMCQPLCQWQRVAMVTLAMCETNLEVTRMPALDKLKPRDNSIGEMLHKAD